MHLKVSTTENFLGNEPLRAELRRIKGISGKSFSEKNEMASDLMENISSLSFVDVADAKRFWPSFWRFNFLNPFKSKVTTFKGYIPPFITFKKGLQFTTGYANLLDKNEAVELSANFNSLNVPRISLSFLMYNLKDADFSLTNGAWFTKKQISISHETNYIPGKDPTHLTELYTLIQNKGSFWTHQAGITLMHPLTFLFDPSPYYKISYKADNRSLLRKILSLHSELAFIFSSQENEKMATMMKISASLKKRFPHYITGHCITGFLISNKPVPLAEKFRIGGIGILRGIKSNELTRNFNFPNSSDTFGSITVDYSPKVFSQINPHLFLNAAFIGNFQASNIFEFTPDLSSVVSIGTGAKYQFNDNSFEVNVQFPIMKSEQLNFVHFQFGITPI